jgi:hypothetical protein
LPSANDLPIPEELKGMAQQILDKISGGNPMEKMQITPEMLKNIKLPPGLTQK